MKIGINNLASRFEIYWFVMLAYKQEKYAEQVLSGDDGLEFFIAKQNIVKKVHGKSVTDWIPVIPNIVFVHASFSRILEFKKKYNFLKFATWKKSTGMEFMIVGEVEMSNFIRVASYTQSEVKFLTLNNVQLGKGTRVRVIDGELKGVTGELTKVVGRRNKQFVTFIPDMAAVTAEIDVSLIEKITE